MKEIIPLRRILSVSLLFAIAIQSRAYADEPTTRPVAHVNHAGLVKLGWQLAGEISTFQDHPAPQAIDLLHSLGFHHLQLSPDQTSNDVDALLAKLKSVHMDVVSYGIVDLGGSEADMRKVFDLAKKLRAKDIIANPPDDSLDMLDKLAAEYRINIAIVNMPKPGNHWNPDDELRLLAERSARMGLCADLAAWKQSGLSPVECANKLAGHIMEIRLSDVDDEKDESAVLGTLKLQGFKGICAISSKTGSGDDRVDRFTRSVNTFSDIIGELARMR
jgi:sugar phosphate isomerase/epimerase